jgi:hypothetical protein
MAVNGTPGMDGYSRGAYPARLTLEDSPSKQFRLSLGEYIRHPDLSVNERVRLVQLQQLDQEHFTLLSGELPTLHAPRYFEGQQGRE